MRLLLAGASTRAASESAAQAGFDVTALDAFGDLDQHPAVRSLSVPREFGVRATATAMARASRSIECDAVAYLSGFENHPRAVATLAAGRVLLGNPPDVLRRVRDPIQVAEAIRTRGFAAPAVRLSDPDDANEWLIKPLASGGGHRIRAWRPVKGRPTLRVPPHCYLQQFIDGTPGSIVFVSAGGRCVPVGVSRQLIGDEAFGAGGYRYCGSLLDAAALETPLGRGAAAIAGAVSEEFGLVGLNGIDFMARDAVAYPIEVNPRWSSSMELVERMTGASLFGVHAAACRGGTVPSLTPRPGTRGVCGKAIVFARHDVIAPDTREWLADPDIRDVPHPGEHIPSGRPICTVFAEAPDDFSCHAALVQRADAVYRRLTDTSFSVQPPVRKRLRAR